MVGERGVIPAGAVGRIVIIAEVIVAVSGAQKEVVNKDAQADDGCRRIGESGG